MVDDQPDSPSEPAPEPPPEELAAPAPDASQETPSELDRVISKAIRYIKAKRGGDLAAIILTGSAARDALLPHSDIDFLVLVRGAENGSELIRFLDRIVEIRYLGLLSVDEQVRTSLRLPVMLRKARVLFEFEGAGTRVLEQMYARFRQGAPLPTIHEKIRLRTQALHWLGKADDPQAQPALARYLFSIYLDECIQAFYPLRGFWPASATESLRFIDQRDHVLGDLLQQALQASDLTSQLEIGRRIADHLFKDVPAPERAD